MTWSAGARLGPYEIVSLIGEGGMGRVYRARDNQLGRDVAIKILPEEFNADADRLMRFEREARSLAALNHPNIAQVYGLESSGVSRAIVMELVDGEDLAERLARGPLPIDEAISVGRQIAMALEAAHEAGIVHRDLKPANVRLRPDGSVKVLDFGLARSVPSGGVTSGDANTPTITSPAMTGRGVVLGTAAYMAPEQARGKMVDRRADLWAMGCVLFEMLTGSRAFGGETITDVLSAVVSRDPDWSRLPSAAPPGLISVMRRCLRKDARVRLQSAGDARVDLEEAATGTTDIAEVPAATRTSWRPALAFMVAGALVTLAVSSLMSRRAASAPDEKPVLRYSVPLPSTFSSAGFPSISPDGRWIALSAIGPAAGRGSVEATLALWLRPMDGEAFQLVAGTEQAVSPTWSPDSRELAFIARGSLYRIGITGGTPTRVADVTTVREFGFARVFNVWPSIAWGTDGTILVTAGGEVLRVAATGGALTPVTKAAPGSNATHAAPSFLPDGRILFSELINGTSVADAGTLMMQSPANGTSTLLSEGRMLARYTRDGLLIARFTSTGASVGTITAHRFDPDRAAVEQPGVVLASDVSPFFSTSETGVLLYRSAAAGSDHRLQWVDARGQPTGDGFDVSGSGSFSLSADERVLALQESNNIMVRDMARGVTSRLVEGPGVIEPILSPDGRRIVYTRVVPPRAGVVMRSTAGGPETMVLSTPALTIIEDWSRDGRYLLAIQSAERRSPNRGVILPLDGNAPPMIFADLPLGAALDEPRFSPDGKWVTYNAADSGRQEVYMTPVPPTGERWQLSTDGGVQGRWHSDGSGVFYLSASGQLMDVAISRQRPPQIGRPRVLFDTGLEVAANFDQFAPSKDNMRFLLRRPHGSAGGVDIHVIVNWPTLLKTTRGTAAAP